MIAAGRVASVCSAPCSSWRTFAIYDCLFGYYTHALPRVSLRYLSLLHLVSLIALFVSRLHLLLALRQPILRCCCLSLCARICYWTALLIAKDVWRSDSEQSVSSVCGDLGSVIISRNSLRIARTTYNGIQPPPLAPYQTEELSSPRHVNYILHVLRQSSLGEIISGGSQGTRGRISRCAHGIELQGEEQGGERGEDI